MEAGGHRGISGAAGRGGKGTSRYVWLCQQKQCEAGAVEIQGAAAGEPAAGGSGGDPDVPAVSDPVRGACKGQAACGSGAEDRVPSGGPEYLMAVSVHGGPGARPGDDAASDHGVRRADRLFDL